MDTAAVDSDTAVEETSSPPVAEESAQPETEVVSDAPETEEADASETDELTLEDPRVKELLKGERARLEESYRRKEEHAQRQAQLQEYERARQQAYSNRVQDQQQKLVQMMTKASEEGTEPDAKAIEEILTETSATGLVETVEGMEEWINGFLREDNPTFFSNVPEALSQAWLDAKTTRRPDAVFAAAMKVAAASGEARGWTAGNKAALQAIKSREAEKQKTQKIRKASEAQETEGTPAMGMSGRTRPKLTLQQIDAMPMREWQAIPKDERATLLEEAHRAANKG